MVFVLGVFLSSGLFLYLALSNETINRRIEAIPYYVRTYINKFRPNVEMPVPPEVSAIAPQTLLEIPPKNEIPTQSNDTPAYFNEEALNPGETGEKNGDTVTLVQSSVLSVAPIASQILLTGITHQWQTWNNCGPSTISMNLSYYGRPETQLEAAQFLKPNQEDKNVSPDEMAAYARSLGFEAIARVGGDLDLLKGLLSNGFPVIVEVWANAEDNGGLGHYRLFIGYDEVGGHFLAEDSLNGSGIQVPIAEFDAFWQVFNRTYVVVYPSDQAALVYAILGQDMIDQTMFERTLITTQIEAKSDPENAYAWFNIGTNYARLGKPELAASAFDEARRLGLPYRMLWYQFDIFEVYLAMGRYQEVVDLATATLQATGGLEEPYYYRGLARQATGQIEVAADDFRAALEYNPNFTPAAAALTALGTSP
jgi:tetratricopeptide (TPR) repeat protein